MARQLEDGSTQLGNLRKLRLVASGMEVSPEIHRLDPARAEPSHRLFLVFDHQRIEERADANGKLAEQRWRQVAEMTQQIEVVPPPRGDDGLAVLNARDAH